MKYIEHYYKFNDYYKNKLNDCIEYKRQNNFDIQRLYNYDVDLEGCVYKKNVDDSCIIGKDKKYELLPLGLKNEFVPSYFINENITKVNVRISFDKVFSVVLRRTSYKIFYYSNNEDDSLTPDYDINGNLRKVCDSYIKYYYESLEESWTVEEFFDMIKDLKYITIKYAKNLDTGEVFAVGFFGSNIRKGAGGECLTNAELYVMPEFRKLGIAKKLVGLSFEAAMQDGIENFDSITYRTPSMDALGFWENIGATVSGLYHIEGNVPEMINQIDDKIISIEK